MKCRHPLFCNHSPQIFSFTTWPPLPTAYCFCFRDHPCKTCPARPSRPLFLLFFVPSVSLHHAPPIRTHLYPSVPIRATFRLSSPNMMFGEISPAIGQENMSWLLIFVSVYLVLLRPCVPAPHSTYANPPHTHLHPYVPPKPCLHVLLCKFKSKK